MNTQQRKYNLHNNASICNINSRTLYMNASKLHEVEQFAYTLHIPLYKVYSIACNLHQHTSKWKRAQQIVLQNYIDQTRIHAVAEMSKTPKDLACITLQIPKSKVGEVQWITKQDPETTALGLSLCQVSVNAVKQKLVSSETTKAIEDACNELNHKHDEAIASLKKRHAEDIRCAEEELASRKRKYSGMLNDELNHVREQYDGKIKRITDALTEENQTLKEHKTSLSQELASGRNAERAEVAERIEHYRNRFEADKKELEASYKDQLAYYRSELKAVQDGRIRLMEQHKQELMSSQEEVKSLVSNLSGSTARVGQIGENFVSQIFSNMELGTLTDTRNETGMGDYFWEWHGNGGGAIKCLVEVKNVTSIHSQKDRAKWWADVNSNIKSGRINAAMLISLRCRVENTKGIDIRLHGGAIPIMHASRAAEDALPAAQLVEIAFNTFASTWPAIVSARGDDAEGVLENAAIQLENQMDNIESMCKRIDAMEKHAIKIQRETVAMKKIKESMVKSIENLRLQNPQLTLLQDHQQESPSEDWDSAEGKALVAAIESFRVAKKGRYPKSINDLDLPQNVQQFAAALPNSFEKGVTIAKGNISRKRPFKV